MIKCTRCLKSKCRSNYYRTSRKTMSECKSCFKDRINSKTRVRKLRLLDIFGDSCLRCGFKEHPSALHFHHLNPRTKEFNVTLSASKRFSLLVREAKKCIVLCANCHATLHAKVWSTSSISIPDYSHVDPEFYAVRKKVHRCIDCDISLKYKSSLRCLKCFNISRRGRGEKIEWPTIKELTERVLKVGYTGVGLELGISDNAVKKKLKRAGISIEYNPKNKTWTLL